MSLLQQVKQHRVRFLKTLCLALCTFMHGLHAGCNGPSLSDLGQQVQSSISQTSLIISLESAGYLTGALICGFWYPWVNFQLATSIIWFILSLVQLWIPFLSQLWSLLLAYFLLGLGMGTFETGSNVFISTLWGTESLPFRQALVLIRGCGSVIAPLILQPFLSHERHGVNSEKYHPELVKLVWPFSLLACMFALTAACTSCVWKLYPKTADHSSRVKDATCCFPESQHSTPSTSSSSTSRKSDFWKHCMIILVIGFLFTDTAIIISIRSFIATFVTHSKLQLAPETGALLTTAFFAASTASQVSGLLYMRWIGLEVYFMISLAVLLCSNAILVPFGDSNEILLWIGIMLAGISTANSSPCIYGYMETFFPITSSIASVIGVIGQSSYVVLPILVSHFIADNPPFLFQAVLVCSCCVLLLLPAIILLGRKQLVRRNASQ